MFLIIVDKCTRLMIQYSIIIKYTYQDITIITYTLGIAYLYSHYRRKFFKIILTHLCLYIKSHLVPLYLHYVLYYACTCTKQIFQLRFHKKTEAEKEIFYSATIRFTFPSIFYFQLSPMQNSTFKQRFHIYTLFLLLREIMIPFF